MYWIKMSMGKKTITPKKEEGEKDPHNIDDISLVSTDSPAYRLEEEDLLSPSTAPQILVVVCFSNYGK
jgi:hypothetical protein